MSFIYSRALVEEFSAGNCSDTDVSQPLNGNPMPKPCLWHDKTMEPSRLSRFGMTCKPLMESRGEALLTWWLAGFPVKTSALPEKAQESPESAAECGRTWLGSLARFDRDSRSWKTVQHSLIEDSEPSSVTWPRSGMTAAGLCWELPMLERHISATGSGFWPTPTVCGNYNRKGASKTSGDGLATAVRMWPTPTAHNAKETNAPSESERNTPTLAAQAGGALNPNWVEWLMGWPIGHTALKQSEMVKSQPLPQPHGESLEALE